MLADGRHLHRRKSVLERFQTGVVNKKSGSRIRRFAFCGRSHNLISRKETHWTDPMRLSKETHHGI
jgi:hypothetical protein